MAHGPVGVHTAHHSHELPFHGRKLKAAERMLAGVLAHHVIAPSRQVAATLADLGVAGSKIDVVHHGFDLDKLDPARANGRAVRRELGLGEGLVVGTVGRDYFLKNHRRLIRAFDAASDALGDARLLIVCGGGGTRLRQFVSGLGLEERVRVTDGREDIPNVLAAMDVYVHPAVAESFGMTVMEAMAMARPVVATSVGIVPEVLRDEVNGVIAASATVSDLEHALRRAVAISDRWPDLGREARRVAKNFTAQGMVATHERLYERWTHRVRDP
jgi:glycosyltransferase involved in cell wall biosynthesis